MARQKLGRTMRQGMTMVRVIAERCTGCGLCTRVCPTDALRMKGGVAEVDEKVCSACAKCVSACPQQAIIFEDLGADAKPVPAVVVQEVSSPTTPWPQSGAKSLARRVGLGAALVSVSREVAPYLVTLALGALERVLTATTPSQATFRGSVAGGKRVRRRWRRRSG